MILSVLICPGHRLTENNIHRVKSGWELENSVGLCQVVETVDA